MNDLLKAMVDRKPITDQIIKEHLFGICDSTHSLGCDDCCPVFEINGHKAPGSDKPFKENRGCDCFKSGEKMLAFLRSKRKTQKHFMIQAFPDYHDIQTKAIDDDLLCLEVGGFFPKDGGHLMYYGVFWKEGLPPPKEEILGRLAHFIQVDHPDFPITTNKL
jgi:hypothetical protein